MSHLRWQKGGSLTLLGYTWVKNAPAPSSLLGTPPTRSTAHLHQLRKRSSKPGRLFGLAILQVFRGPRRSLVYPLLLAPSCSLSRRSVPGLPCIVGRLCRRVHVDRARSERSGAARTGFHLVREKGSHHIFKRDGFQRLLNLQDSRGMAKTYQVRLLLPALDELGVL